ncbi:MAG: hypothetical protein ACREUB_04680 [Burkholderiales bacterium]
MTRRLLVVAAIALLAPAVAAARDARPGFGARVQASEGQQMKKGPGQPTRGDHKKRLEPDKGHKSRLTDAERQELHRDVDRAGREIYRK